MSGQLHIDFVCTGNICRSPMAEYIARSHAEEAGLDVRITSSGTGNWHVGHSADQRALAELAAHDYDGTSHRARQVGPDTLSADLIIALDTGHRSRLIASGADKSKVVLLRDFDPAAPANSSVEDPYYGGPEGFVEARQQIEAAMLGLLEWIRQQQRA